MLLSIGYSEHSQPLRTPICCECNISDFEADQRWVRRTSLNMLLGALRAVRSFLVMIKAESRNAHCTKVGPALISDILRKLLDNAIVWYNRPEWSRKINTSRTVLPNICGNPSGMSPAAIPPAPASRFGPAMYVGDDATNNCR